MKLIKLKDVFDVKYGRPSLALNSMTISDNGIPFVSRQERNNGVAARVEEIEGVAPNPPHTLSVAASGSVLATFYQPEPYYTAYHVFCLVPKKQLSVVELLVYSKTINSNKYKYSYGRQANKTLRELLIPDRREIGILCKKFNLLKQPSRESSSHTRISLGDRIWKWFRYDEIFQIRKGKRLTKRNMKLGKTPFVGAIDSNNGYRQFIDQKADHTGNTITVNYNGSVGEAFFQPSPYCASDDVNVLYPLFKMNVYIGLFLVSLIKFEKYRFNYGRKWHKDRMSKSNIKLPIDTSGNPDWQFMQDYIKSLPYSSNL